MLTSPRLSRDAGDEASRRLAAAVGMDLVTIWR
jgi:hypothetical protein